MLKGAFAGRRWLRPVPQLYNVKHQTETINYQTQDFLKLK